MRRGRWLLCALVALGCAPLRDPLGVAREPEAPRLVSLAALERSIVVDIRYAGRDNFVGRPVPGYDEELCLLSEPAARALVAVQRRLGEEGLGLVVWDCYRPERAVKHFLAWARGPDDSTQDLYYPAVPKSELVSRGYIAPRSSHSRGSAVDVGLVEWAETPSGGWAWSLLNMGTPFDFFDPRSHRDAEGLWEEHRTRRRLLRRAMEAQGFQPYAQEWWHFSLADEPYPDRSFDLPVASTTASP